MASSFRNVKEEGKGPAAKRPKLRQKSPKKKIHKPNMRTTPSDKTDDLLTVERVYRSGEPDLDKGGKWILYLDNEHKTDADKCTRLDKGWKALQKLLTMGKLLAVEWLIPSRSFLDGVICCHTANFYDTESIKTAASDIGKAMHPYYHMEIYYKLARDCYCEGPSLYMYNFKDDVLHCLEFPPSRVMNVPPRLIYGKPDWKKGGKWVLHLDNTYRSEKDGLTKLERAWQAIKKSYDGNKFPAVECSTAVSPDGLIYCYTGERTLVGQVESSALAIREAVPDYIDDLEYRCADDMHGKALYKFDSKKEIYKWDEFDLKEFFKEEATSISEDETIPSEATDREYLSSVVFGVPEEEQGKWVLFYDNRYRDKNRLTKLDQVWFDVKNKIISSDICEITCSTAIPENLMRYDNDGYLCFFNSYCQGVDEVKSIAAAIRAKVKDSAGDMYYSTGRCQHDQGNYLYKFNRDCEFFTLRQV